MSTKEINNKAKTIYFKIARSFELIGDAMAKEEHAAMIAKQRIVEETLSVSRSHQRVTALRCSLDVLGNISGEVSRVMRDAIRKEEEMIDTSQQIIVKEKEVCVRSDEAIKK
jgi:hypothetical protein